MIAKVPQKVLVIGLGFVGQTLALKLASVGFEVYGVDVNERTLDGIRQGCSHIREPGLNELIDQYLGETFHVGLPETLSEQCARVDAIVICVGTDFIRGAEEPELTSLKQSAEWVGRHVRPGQLVIVRSTVPIGTTRSVLLPKLEIAGMKGGHDFMLAFCPERTIEGAAIAELGILPQIVGPLDEASGDCAESLFSKVTPHVVRVSSPESAEAVKLMDNSFRDVRFGYANTLAQLFEALGLDSFELIRAANCNYPRNSIPIPSPGVGGSCIPKDSRFLSYSASRVGVSTPLITEARQANERMIKDIMQRLEQQVDLKGARVFVAGFAFKGFPETNDTRESPTLDLVSDVGKEGACVSGYDPAVGCAEIAASGATPVTSLNEGLRDCDVCIFMTNHPEFTNLSTTSLLQQLKPGTLVVDGWGLFDRKVLEAAKMRYLGVGIG